MTLRWYLWENNGVRWRVPRVVLEGNRPVPRLANSFHPMIEFWLEQRRFIGENLFFDETGRPDQAAHAAAGMQVCEDSERKKRERRCKVPNLAVLRRPTPGRWEVTEGDAELIYADLGLFGRARRPLPILR